MERRFLEKRDLWLIAGLLLISGLLWLVLSSRDQGAKAEIYLDSRLIRTVDLSSDRLLRLEEVPEIELEVSHGRIRFLSSDCPDQICVHTGYISRPGEYAVCLPHRLMIRIPEDSEAPDAVTGRRLP